MQVRLKDTKKIVPEPLPERWEQVPFVLAQKTSDRPELGFFRWETQRADGVEQYMGLRSGERLMIVEGLLKVEKKVE